MSAQPVDRIVDVIEIRKAKNGYVISAFMHERYRSDSNDVRGYVTHVVESDDPVKVGEALAQVLKETTITRDVLIYPARELP